MTKTYKIGNKEIQGITKNELSHLASKHRRLWYILRDLLEALSDKEEVEKQEECEGDCYFCNPLGWADRNPVSIVTIESFEKIKLEHMKNKEAKQSTSLKEDQDYEKN